jgi:hypothetical protein
MPKIYKDPDTPLDQFVYFTMQDLTQATPEDLKGEYDGDTFIPSGETKIYESQKQLVIISDPEIRYEAEVAKWKFTIPAENITQWSDGFIFFNDPRTGLVTIDFEVVYPDNHNATFDQVAGLSNTQNNNIQSALTVYGVPTDTSIKADITAQLAAYGVATGANVTSATSGLATQASLTSVSSLVSAIKAVTDQLSITAIRSQVDASLLAYGLPSLTQMTAAFSEIKGSGWTNQTLVNIYANEPSISQIQSQLTSSLGTYGAAKTTELNSAVSTLAKSSDLGIANTGISTLLSRTSDITLTNINTQVGLAITNSGMPNTLSIINNGVSTIRTAQSQLTLDAIIDGVWTADERSLTESPTGEGISVSDIVTGVWSAPVKVVTGIPAGYALSSDMQSVLSYLLSIKGSTDNLTVDGIAARTWTIGNRTLTSSTSGGITAQELQDGLRTFGAATSANITSALTTLTTQLNSLNDISVDEIMDSIIESTYTLKHVLRLLASESAGNGTKINNTIIYTSLDGTKNRIAANCTETTRTVTKDVS